jgi:hypothetical protein
MAQENRKSKKKWAAEPISYRYFDEKYSKIPRRLEGVDPLGGRGLPRPVPANRSRRRHAMVACPGDACPPRVG